MKASLMNTLGRVFVKRKLEGLYEFYNCMKVGAIDQNLGSYELVKVPGNDGTQVVVGVIKQPDGDITTTMSGAISIDSKSNLEKLKKVPQFDMQIHYGVCGRPDDFRTFSSAIVLNDVVMLNYSISDAVTNTPTERAIMQETASLVARSMYRVVNPEWEQSYSEPINFIDAIEHYPTYDCDGVHSESTWLGISYSASEFKHYFLFTKDDGETWVTIDTDSNPHTTSPLYAGMAISGNKIFWSVYNFVTLFVYSADISSILEDDYTAPYQIYTESDTSINDMDASNNYIWCAGGQIDTLIMSINVNTQEITKYNVSSYTTQPMRVVSALNDNFVIFGGDLSVIMAYKNGIWYKHEIIVEEESSTITDIVALSETHWVAVNTHNVYITYDGGKTWRATLSLKHDWNVAKFDFYDSTVGYLATETKIYRTMDGGNSWGEATAITASSPSEPSSIAISTDDVNKIMVTKFSGKVYSAI